MFPRPFLMVATFLLLFVITSCKSDKNPISPGGGIDYGNIAQIEYTTHVQALLDKYCVSCHGAQRADAGLRLDSWDELVKGSNFQEVIIPFDADHSLLNNMLTKLVGGVHPGELGRETLDSVKTAFMARWVNEGARNDGQTVPYANPARRLYVCSQDAAVVDIIDVDTKMVVRKVDLQKLGFPADAKPHHVAVSPDGQFWFVSMISAGTILKFNSNNELVGQDTTAVPALLAHLPNENVLLASRFISVVQQSLYALNTTTMEPLNDPNTPDGKIALPFPVPHALTLSRDGNFAYTASLSDNELMVINTATKEFETGIPLGSGENPLQITVSPDNTTLYISAQGKGQMLIVDVTDPLSPALIDSVAVGTQPWHPVYTPDGSRVYVGNLGSSNFSVINTASRTAQTFGAGDGSDGLSQPHGIAVTPDGQYVFISNRNVNGNYHPRHDFGDNSRAGTVVVINTATNQIEKVLEIEAFGSGMAIWPN